MATYNAITDAMIDIDSPVDETLLSYMRGNIQVNRFALMGVYFAEGTTAVTSSFVSIGQINLYIPNLPDEAAVTRQIVAEVDAKNSSGIASTYFRIQDNGTGTTGTTDTITGTTYGGVTSTLSVASTWAGTTRLIQFMAKASAGTAYLKSDNRVTVRVYF